MTNIYQAVNAVMAEIGAIGKEKKNQKQGFMYRGVDDVMNALAPLFSKHKLFVVPEVLNQVREERRNNNGTNLIYSIITMKYTFYAEDGTNVTSVVVGEGMDTGDKATNKAMSIAFKYACFQLFCIPTEETHPDPDKETHEVSQKGQKKAECAPKRDALKKEVVALGQQLGYTAKELAVRFKITPETSIEELYNIEAALADELKEKGVKA